MNALLSVRELGVAFRARARTVHAVNGVSFDVRPGETFGVAGESGCGKTVTMMSLLRLLPRNADIEGAAHFAGRDLLRLSHRELRAIRGREIAMVFQDPLSSLHPAYRIGDQVAEAVRTHQRNATRQQARDRAVELFELVGVPNASVRAQEYPHQWSGGMRQRAMIAMAMANRPRLLIADEPTSSLDVTIQAQVMTVLRAAARETRAATILITHDLALLAQVADRVAVMYGGRVVESADVDTIFTNPRHPYTIGLLASLPSAATTTGQLQPIPGRPPVVTEVAPGCCFEPRCSVGAGSERCRCETPPLTACECETHVCACHFRDNRWERT